MSGTKEYYLKLKEQEYNELSSEEQIYLNRLGMQVKQLPSEDDLNDENYKEIKKLSIEYYKQEQSYLFNKRGGKSK